MHSVSVITTSALVACAAAQILNIAQVDEAVSYVLQTFAGYFIYDGSHLDGWEPTNPQNPSDPSYWLADIAHDGYAAFNPNASTYQVFRNVKDYGAKGN
jgi:glucan 1,3-beta-glucosidase